MCFYDRELDSMLALCNVMWPCTRAHECQDTYMPHTPSNSPPNSCAASPHLTSQAQQALSVALNKLGELHHLQGDLAAAAQLYDQALQLRRQLLAATQQQWHQASAEAASGLAAAAPRGGGANAAGPVAPVEPVAGDGGGAEGQEACCSAALDLAASCLKLAGARRGLGADADAEVCPPVAAGLHSCMWPCCRATTCVCANVLNALLAVLPSATCAASCLPGCRPCCRRARRCCSAWRAALPSSRCACSASMLCWRSMRPRWGRGPQTRQVVHFAGLLVNGSLQRRTDLSPVHSHALQIRPRGAADLFVVCRVT